VTIGVPDPLYGEEDAAFIVLKDGGKACAEELIAHYQSQLADYKCPKFPFTASSARIIGIREGLRLSVFVVSV